MTGRLLWATALLAVGCNGSGSTADDLDRGALRGAQADVESEVTGPLGFTPATVLAQYREDGVGKLFLGTEDLGCEEFDFGHLPMTGQALGPGYRLEVGFSGPRAEWVGAHDVTPSLYRFDCVEESPDQLFCPNTDYVHGNQGEVVITADSGGVVEGTVSFRGTWVDSDMVDLGVVDVDAVFRATLCPDLPARTDDPYDTGSR